MRIIGGLARGTKLYTLDGLNTRPTLDRVRESLFNILQNNIRDAKVLDLFAGSGAIGLEALSRGAEKAILCDKNKTAIEIIKQNVHKLRMQDKAIIKHMDYEQFLKTSKEKFNFIYIDPPYKTNFISNSLEIICNRNLLEKDAVIVAETDELERIENEIKELGLSINIYDVRKYGRARLIFMRKE